MDEHNSTPAPEGIAIIGMSGRFPGAKDVEQFWQNLVKGVDSVSHFSETELEYSVATPEAMTEGQKFIRARGVIEGVDLFDAEFFGMYPREAQLIDPQHRLFLECAWEALESAGHAPESYPGLIGVYAGLAMNTYLLHNLCVDRAFAADFSANYQVGGYPTMLGNDKDFMPTRVSYKLNLRGPSMTIQSACSTSLVAVCQACSSLLTYQCDMALAGGVSITFPQKRDYQYQEEGLASADGTCRTFDANACGTVFGHGVAIVLLKRFEDAISDGNPILAVIKGFAVNNDGCDKIGYAAPSVTAQAEVIAMAHANAGIDPDTVSYVEAHGTATPLGDPIEVAALTAAFRRGGSSRNQYCALGTGKTHIGHLDVAAGATGLIKTVLQLQHECIPPLLHFKAPNPKIDFGNSPFFPVSTSMAWKRGDAPRRAGVSAMGIGGTNAHLVVEEAPLSTSGPSRETQLLLLSAKTARALTAMSGRLADYLEHHPESSLGDVAFTLQCGRQRFRHRMALCAANTTEAIEGLRAVDCETTLIAQAPVQSPSLVFLFPGQGSQCVNMGRELYEHEPVFHESVDRCAQNLQGHLGFDVRSVLYPEVSAKAEAERQINETRVTQPAIFTVEYALACLWMAWGIKPSLLIGHSVGEYVAAVLAGVFSLEDALGVLAGRAKLMQDLPPGSMLAVRRGVAQLEGMLSEDVAIAAINSPFLTTLSGPTERLRELQQNLEAAGVFSRLLPTSHAFHSSMMDPIVEPFAKLVDSVPRQKPTLPWISTFTGEWMDNQVAPEGSYWAGQLRRTVRFGQAIEIAINNGATTFLEVGPGQALTQLVLQQPPTPIGRTAVTSLTSYGTNPADMESMLTSLSRLWLNGIEPDWRGFYSTEKRKRMKLPTYPFERKRYWIAAPTQAKNVQVPSVATLLEGDAPGNGRLAVACDEASAALGNKEDSTTPQTTVTAATQPYTCHLIEKQVQLMAQQLEMLHRRAVAGKANNGIR
jgi:acyl transferase domain-containing protein